MKTYVEMAVQFHSLLASALNRRVVIGYKLREALDPAQEPPVRIEIVDALVLRVFGRPVRNLAQKQQTKFVPRPTTLLAKTVVMATTLRYRRKKLSSC